MIQFLYNMAKKATKSKKESRILSLNRKELLSSPQSYRSLFFGVATVVILFLIGFGITRLFLGNPTPEIDNGAVSTSSIEEALNNKSDYTVKVGDTLWSIAEEEYGSGFEWYRIADANNITDSTSLEEGTNLIVPAIPVEPDVVVTEVTPTMALVNGTVERIEAPTMEVPATERITGDSYTIKQGDDLWNIAVRAYGDGYKWVEIANANKLENPNLIHSDNKLVLPR